MAEQLNVYQRLAEVRKSILFKKNNQEVNLIMLDQVMS